VPVLDGVSGSENSLAQLSLIDAIGVGNRVVRRMHDDQASIHIIQGKLTGTG